MFPYVQELTGNKLENELENETNQQGSIDSIVTLNVTISDMANFLKSKSNDERINKDRVGFEKILTLKKEFKSNISVILQSYFREKQNQKTFRIGLIGLMNIEYIYLLK